MESISKINVRRELQYTFHQILELLSKCGPLDIAAQEALTNKLMALFVPLGVYTESFWDNIALSKEPYSAFFVKREFPVYDVDGIKINQEHVKEPINVSTLRLSLAERIKLIQAKYNLRDCMIQSLSTDYIDEASGTDGIMFKSLDSSRYYEIVSQDIVNEIFRILKKLELYSCMLHLFCLLVSTREYVHLAMENHVLDYMFTTDVKNPFLNPRYLEIIHYCLFYGLYVYYREECADRIHVSYKYRYVMTLDAVSRLPQFAGPLTQSPFLPAPLASKYLYAENIAPTDYFIKPIMSDKNGRGFYTSQEFKARFEVFTDGLFNGFPVDKIYFSGSCIAACAMRSPLEALFGVKQCSYTPIHPPPDLHPGHVDWVMWQNILKNVYDYWTKDQRLVLEAYFNEYYPSKTILPSAATSMEELLTTEDLLSDIDIIIDDHSDDGFDKKTLLILDHLRTVITARIGREPTELELSLLKINGRKKHKYYIAGTLLKRSLEIFRMYGKNAIAGISRFHFPIVRGTYDGNNVYILPSMIAYAHTGMFMDYRWSSSAKDTKDLILKYYMRGGVAILNDQEHKGLAQHIRANSQWGIFQQFAHSDLVQSVMNPIFRPSLSSSGFWEKLRALGGSHAIPSQYIIELHANPSHSTVGNSHFGFDLSLRFPSGNLKPMHFWKVLAYVSDLHISGAYTPTLTMPAAPILAAQR